MFFLIFLIWSKIRKLSGKYSQKPYPNLKSGQNTITSKKEVADIFVRHYAQISTAKEEHRIPQNIEKDNNSNDMAINQDFNMKELDDSVQLLEEGKSSGEDQIDNTILKHLPQATKQYLLHLFNKLWTEGTFPLEWKTSIIPPILKPGKEQTNPKNCRPMSLTGNICKFFERMVNKRLIWFLEKTHKFSPQQFGFRPRRNTIDPIASLTTDILNGFKERRTTTAVLFDSGKAFETASRNTIITNLKEMGITGKMLNFIHSYLKNRSIKVKIGNTVLERRMVTAGVPQGGVLSATCFLVAIDTIMDTLHNQECFELHLDCSRTLFKNLKTGLRPLA